jgi:hypothetical protein
LFTCKLKRTIQHLFSIPSSNRNISEFASLVNKSSYQETWISIFQATQAAALIWSMGLVRVPQVDPAGVREHYAMQI